VGNSIEDYIPAKDAAEIIGIEYSLLMARIYKGKVKSEKMGWGVIIHKDEVERERLAQIERESEKHVDNKDMEGSAG
jgi:hypothetical protein